MADGPFAALPRPCNSLKACGTTSLSVDPGIRVAIHSRIVQPLLDITLLFLGLPLVAVPTAATSFWPPACAWAW